MRSLYGSSPTSNKQGDADEACSEACPACYLAPLQSFQLLALPLDDLHQAVWLKELALQQKQEGFLEGGNDPPEASYLLLAEDYAGRTGRWTAEEIAFRDFCMDAFDRGQLWVQPGTRLSDFLCQLLLCKPTRLTKKMKKANLASRSYELLQHQQQHLQGESPSHPPLDVVNLSLLEQRFLASIPGEAAQLEMRFHLHRFWRSLFASAALQVNDSLVDMAAWLDSLEVMEDKASEVESLMRRTRRKRMQDSILVGSAAGATTASHHQRARQQVRTLHEEDPTLEAIDNSTSNTMDGLNDEDDGLEELLGELLGGLLDEPEVHKKHKHIMDPTSLSAGSSLMHYQHSSSSLVSEVSTDETVLTERLLADLLGDQMPSVLLHCDSAEGPSSTVSGDLVPYYLSLRLLLLRAANRRSAAENDLVQTICTSYLNYIQNRDRSQAAVCQLLVRDFHYLQCNSRTRCGAKSVSPFPRLVAAPGRNISLPYQSYKMDLPAIARSNSHAANTSPMVAPQPLFLPDATAISSLQQHEATRHFAPSF